MTFTLFGANQHWCMIPILALRGHPLMVSTRRRGVKLRWTHLDEGASALMEGSAPCGRPSIQKIRAHWRHPVFSCKAFGAFCSRISSWKGIKSGALLSTKTCDMNNTNVTVLNRLHSYYSLISALGHEIIVLTVSREWSVYFELMWTSTGRSVADGREGVESRDFLVDVLNGWHLRHTWLIKLNIPLSGPA